MGELKGERPEGAAVDCAKHSRIIAPLQSLRLSVNRSSVAKDALTKIYSFDLYDFARLVKTREHSVANSIPQSVLPRYALRSTKLAIVFGFTGSSRHILKIRRNYGGLLIVVATIQNEAYRVPYPIGRLNSA